MGQYILCTSELAKHPFCIRELGLGLYSGEELCYYISHNLALIDQSFISSELLSFIDTELDMRDTANKMRRMLDPNNPQPPTLEQVLLLLVREMHYYSEEELKGLAQELERFRKMSDEERLLERGDALVARNKYNSAISVYEQYLKEVKRKGMSAAQEELVWQHLAVVYIRQYLFDKGLECLQHAYDLRHNPEILRQIYFLSMYSDVKLPADYFTVESPETLMEWQDEYHLHTRLVTDRLENSRLNVIMTRDSVKREKELQAYLEEVKQNYRDSE